MKHSRTIAIILILSIVALVPFACVVSAYTRSHSILSGGLEFDPVTSTKIYDINGDLISELFDENRTVMQAGTVPITVKHAFLAAEDRNFYLHPGFDLTGIARALVIDMASGEIRQGGSTITQQLVKQLYTKSERTFRRKLIELFLARELERRYGKEEILEMYLNQIYFGHGVYGVNAAARFYFNKDIEVISPVEAALLASIPAAPGRFSPLRRPRAAFEKSRQVIQNMIAAGYLSRDGLSESFEDFWLSYLPKIRTRFGTVGVRNKQSDRAPYFTEYIRRILVERFGETTVYRGGLKVYTTLDLRQQKAAEDALKKGLTDQNESLPFRNRTRMEVIDRRIAHMGSRDRKAGHGDIETGAKFARALREECIDEFLLASLLFGIEGIENTLAGHLGFYDRVRDDSRVEGALIALDPSTGAITAMVGGSDFTTGNQLNRAVQSIRQPGSAFKIFVYGAGIESKRITPATPFYDMPVLFKGTRTVWKPSNYEKSYRGRVLVRKALAASLNIVSVLIVDEIGAGLVADYASRLIGIPEKRFSVDPTISLGTSDISPLEMARGIASYANGGRSVKCHAIRHILNRYNKKIFDMKILPEMMKEVISAETAFIMTSMLRSVVDEGTATGAIRGTSGFHLPAAGKTGTTTKFRDAWFAGYTPDLAAVVWMGCDSPSYSLGAGRSAAAVAAPVWGNFMREVYTFRKPGRFREKPDGVLVRPICSKTGRIPIDGCPTRKEYFIDGTEPVERCDSDHDEIISIFDLARKRKNDVLRKEQLKLEESSGKELHN